MNTLNALQHKEQIKEQIAELVERLEENGSYSLSFYEEYSKSFATREYLGDMIMEWADSQVDIYYSSLVDWIRYPGEAVDYIQRAVAEGLVDTADFDIYKAIQCAQYLFYSDEVYADYATLEQLHKLHRELAELEQQAA
jgi:hypothetical protein